MKQTAGTLYACEADVVDGLETLATEELLFRFHDRVQLWSTDKTPRLPGAIRFNYSGNLRALRELRTIQAVFVVLHFPVPRPRALLGEEHLRNLLKQIAIVRSLDLESSYRTFSLNAAGSGSEVMTRLRKEIEIRTGLVDAPYEGDLLIRLRRSASAGEGWEALARLSPRPLATRPWRVCNFEGALNATIAYAMVMLTKPVPDDVFLNIACGSGTILIERLAYGPATKVIGCDNNLEALECANANVDASGFGDRIELNNWDARSLPLADGSVDALCADLPFGHLVGSHEANMALYPLVLREASRVAKPGAFYVLITHEVKLMESLLYNSNDWQLESTLMVKQRGYPSRIFVLRRHPNPLVSVDKR